jgi:hypothetical protein
MGSTLPSGVHDVVCIEVRTFFAAVTEPLPHDDQALPYAIVWRRCVRASYMVDEPLPTPVQFEPKTHLQLQTVQGKPSGRECFWDIGSQVNLYM